MRLIAELLFWLFLLAAGVGWALLSGLYDVSAARPYRPEVRRTLRLATSLSVRRHAKETGPLLNLRPSMVRAGADYFQRTCVPCHGAPGVRPGDIALGLQPKPPDLAEASTDWTGAEVFWIVKNGLKFTAMPGWGPTHSDEELRAIAAFLERLPSLSPSAYDGMLKGPPAAGASYAPATAGSGTVPAAAGASYAPATAGSGTVPAAAGASQEDRHGR